MIDQFFVGLTPSPPARCHFAWPPLPSFSPSFTLCLPVAVRYLVCRRTEARLLNKAAAVITRATNTMSASSEAAKLQTPPQQRQVHYISDNVYSLGTLSCAVCGQTFPIHTNACQRSTCGWCGTLHEPGTHSALQKHHRAMRRTSDGVKTSSKMCSLDTSAALFFTEKEVTAAVEYIRQTLGGTSPFGAAPGAVGGAKSAGITEVDNRIIEEAFCETCGVHRPCKTFARQTRSADEGQTIFFQCTKCSSEWQQNS
ncbi:transcription factor S-II-like protein [Leishmania infantum JPCM5]|uniref:Transcription factor S-II-like protein n=1 Tax=Leishmania infantum TaxID=5671 RepID=A4IE59_LEIIN|nr:transcription factor S-II-like protein [Leishmania infantum JPCM5]CAM73150.1 transcription factor S-II-like protein [Leishmania infantum JPCM5]|eukprot:XP_001470028.1 transcription factor S-II-like protein [Leishmania infantum JPCM5]